MKNKIVTTVLSFCLIFLGGVLWKVHQYLSSESIHQADKQGQAHVSSMLSSVQIEMKSFVKTLGQYSAQPLSSDKVSWAQMNPVLGMLKIEFKNAQWVVVEFALNDKILDPALQKMESLQQKISLLKLPTPQSLTETKDLKETYFHFSKFDSNTKNALLGVTLISAEKGYLFITSADLFQGILDSFKDDSATLALVSDSGIAVAHTKAEYIGTSVSENPLWAELSAAKVNEGSGTYQLEGGPAVLGNYSKIGKTNLYGMITRPMSAVAESSSKIVWQFLFLGLGFILCIAGVMLKFFNFESEKTTDTAVHKVKKIDQSLLMGAVPVAEEKKVFEVLKDLKPEDFKNESDQNKMEIYKKVAVAVGHEIQAPLNSILGYCQMVLSSSPDRQIEGNIESILRETRSAKNVMEKLFAFSGEIVSEKVKMNINGTIDKALKKMSSKIETKNIKIEKNLTSQCEILLNSDSIVKVIENILENSIEAMERMSQKLIKIKTYETEEKLFLEIEDQGEGIAVSELGKIFDPFYTTKSYSNHMGMGLSVAVGILQDHQASLQMSSEKGKGAKVTIEFQKKMQVPEFTNLNKKNYYETTLKAPKSAPVIAEDFDKTIVLGASLPEASYNLKEEQEKTIMIQNDFEIDQMLDLPPVSAEQKISSKIETFQSEEFEAKEKHEIKASAKPLIKKERVNLDEYIVEIRRPGERL